MSQAKLLIKLGGAALVDSATLAQVIEALPQLQTRYGQIYLVHGGGPLINKNLTNAGLTWEFIEGQRVTTPEMMSIISSTLATEVNSQLVNQLRAAGIPAVGVAGFEDQTLLCVQLKPELCRVGVVHSVNAAKLRALAEDSIPVISPIGIDQNGLQYNINADWAAAQVAAHMQVDRLIFLTDQIGVLDSFGRLVPELNENGLTQLALDGVVSGGMLAKVRAVQMALENGVTRVDIIKGTQIISAIEDCPGTLITKRIPSHSTELIVEASF